MYFPEDEWDRMIEEAIQNLPLTEPPLRAGMQPQHGDAVDITAMDILRDVFTEEELEGLEL